MFTICVVLDRFYSRAFEGPVVVHREKRVLDATPEAEARGISVGMPLSEAQSILAAEGRFVVGEEEPYRPAQTQWLNLLSQFSDVIEPREQHVALADFSGHPRAREAVVQLESVLRNAGHMPRFGVARCRWVAELAAQLGDPLGLAYADPEGYVANVPTSHLPFDTDTVKRLNLLGYRTAGELAEVSLETLRAQFGDPAHEIAQAAIGRGDSHVAAQFPKDSVAERFVYEGPPSTREELENGLGKLAQAVGKRLTAKDLIGRTLELFLEHEDATITRRSRTFARSIATDRDVLAALRLMLRDDLPEQIESIRVRLPDLTAARRVQLNMHGNRSRKDRDESVRTVLQHVRSTFGDVAVVLGSEVPEERWVRVRRAYQQVNGFPWN